jgi:hypothetical protein
MPTLPPDTIDDILYFARANDVQDLSSTLSDLHTQTQQSIIDIISAARDEYSKNTAVHYAAGNGHLDILKLILPSGSESSSNNTAIYSALINAVNDSGNTALHWAALNGHLECVKYLVSRGADVTIINAAGHDAVFEAEINDKKDVVDWLLGAVEELEKGITQQQGGGGSQQAASGGEEVEEVTIRMGKMGTEANNGSSAHG